MTAQLEVWLRGPVPGVIPELQPVAHALLQALEDAEAATADLEPEAMWTSVGGLATVGFHLRHLAGSTDRLLAAARGAELTEAQQQALERERGHEPDPLEVLIANLRSVVDSGLAQLRATRAADLPTPRALGRRRVPTTTGDLLHHAGQHAARHSGQIVTTAKLLAL